MTLVFYPHWGLPNKEELKILCEDIEPMMYTQLWRKWDPINIPVSTRQIEVIGFAKHNLDDEDFDIAFPPIEKSELDHQTQAFKKWFSPPTSLNGSVAGYPVISYADIARK